MTKINKIEIIEDGSIQVRLTKTPTSGNEGVKENWGNHRCAAAPGVDLSKLLSDVNNHLSAMGVEVIPQAEWDKISAHSQIAWTPEVIAAFKASTEG